MDKKEGGRVVGCKTIPEDGSVTTADVTFPVDAEQAVTGWEDADGNAVGMVAYGQEIYVLYAVVKDGHWLHFETNGGSYIAPQFFTDTPDEPTTNPTKPGYTFGGWYLDERCMDPADFSKITGTCIVYANWIPEDGVKYTVLHMQENANDDGYSTKDITTDSGEAGFCVSMDEEDRPFSRTLVLIPKLVVLGIGCRRGIESGLLEQAILDALKTARLSLQSVKKACTIELKAKEQAVLDFCGKYGIPLETFPAQELMALPP